MAFAVVMGQKTIRTVCDKLLDIHSVCFIETQLASSPGVCRGVNVCLCRKLAFLWQMHSILNRLKVLTAFVVFFLGSNNRLVLSSCQQIPAATGNLPKSIFA